jgi:hypothetical protein
MQLNDIFTLLIIKMFIIDDKLYLPSILNCKDSRQYSAFMSGSDAKYISITMYCLKSFVCKYFRHFTLNIKMSDYQF